MSEWIESIPFIALALFAAYRTPVSEHRKYGPIRQGARDAMHNFAHSMAPVPRDQVDKAP